MNLLTGGVGPVYAHKEHVVPALAAVHPETVLTSQHRPFQSGSCKKIRQLVSESRSFIYTHEQSS